MAKVWLVTQAYLSKGANMQKILNYAQLVGFDASAVVQTNQIPFDRNLLNYCKENLCGRYGVNYSCPPHCGTPEQMQQKILQARYAVVVQSLFDDVNFDDKQKVANCKMLHNNRLEQMLQLCKQSGYHAFVVGATGCEKCEVCGVTTGQPCPHSQQIFSCTSAYCIDVAQLLQMCNLAYDWKSGKLFLCGLIVVA